MKIWLIPFVVMTLLNVIPAQAASYTYYGNGFGGLYGNPPIIPTLTAVGVPQLGATMTVRYQGPTFSTHGQLIGPLLFTGLSRTTWNGWSLPYPASLLIRKLNREPGSNVDCNLLCSVDWITYAVFPRTQGYTTFQIPNDPNLLGYEALPTMVVGFTVQTIPFSFLTNGGELTIGS